MKADEEFVTFPITVGDETGKTTITATLNGKTTFQKIEIGTDKSYLPDELSLELHIPTDEMHVNSEMPFSVFLKTTDDVLVRAPHDVEIRLEYENQLGSVDSEFLLLNKEPIMHGAHFMLMKRLEIRFFEQFMKNLD